MEEKSPIQVLLVDDHSAMRGVLGDMLREHGGVDVIGEARDGLGAIEFLNQRSVDAVLMDVSMPRLDGIKATRAIRCLWPQVAVVGVSVDAPDQPACLQMLHAGADSVVAKSEDTELPAEITRGVQKALAKLPTKTDNDSGHSPYRAGVFAR